MRRCEDIESLTLFSNDCIDLMVCVDLFTHLTYTLYWIHVLQYFPHFKVETCGNIYTQSLIEIQDLVKHNSIVQRIVKHDFSKTFWVYLFFQNFPGLEIAVLKFHHFSRLFVTVWTLNMTIGCGSLNQTKIYVQAVGNWIIYLKLQIRVTF